MEDHNEDTNSPKSTNTTKSEPIKTKVCMKGDKSACVVQLQGATVTSWRIKEYEQLFLSEKAVFDDSNAIRGGVNVVFPRFGPKCDKDYEGPTHGFARSRPWEQKGKTLYKPNGDVQAEFVLADDYETRQVWKHGFQLLYTVTLSERDLECCIEVKNTG